MIMLPLNDQQRLWIIDKAKGLKTREYYRQFISSFKWSADELRSYQEKKLQQVLQHAFEYIPYYREVFNSLKLKPEDISSIEDINLLPVLSREIITTEYNRLIDSKSHYSKLFKSSSSGTTGTPIQYIHDNEGESAGIAAGLALYALSGWKPGIKSLHIWGNPVSIKKWNTFSSKTKRRLMNQINFPAYLLNDISNYQSLLDLIRREKPEFIDGYASSITSFAIWLKEQNKTCDGIRAVFTTAENITPSGRRAIEETLGQVSDLYGCGEINGIALQPVNQNRYLILESHVIVETVFQNGLNEILVTDLDNRVMPLIRYRIGDTINGLSDDIKISAYPFKTFANVDGRIADHIKLPGGKVIHPVNLLGGTFLRKFPQIRKHKVIWNGKILRFVLECADPIDEILLSKEITDNLSSFDVGFEVEFTERLLPGKSGKYRYIEIE